MHTIIGGSNFDKTVDYAATQEGKCTTAPISIDKSSYWTREWMSNQSAQGSLAKMNRDVMLDSSIV